MKEITLKEIIIAVLMVAAGIANAYFWKVLVFSESYTAPYIFSLPIAALFIFAILFSLAALFIENRILGSVATAAALIGSFLFVEASTTALAGLVITGVGAIWAYKRIHKEMRLSVSFSLSKILRQGLPLFFTMLAFMVSVFYFSSISHDKNQAVIPKAVFDFSIPFLQSTIQGIIPGFRSDATVDELLLGAAQQQAGKSVDISKLPKGQLEQLLAEERQSLAKGFGTNITGKEKASDLLYKLANQKLEGFAGPYKDYLPYLTAFGFFLAVKVLTLPLYLITLGLLWGVIQLLLWMKVLKKEVITVQVEKVTL